jgi:hypothetical protein
MCLLNAEFVLRSDEITFGLVVQVRELEGLVLGAVLECRVPNSFVVAKTRAKGTVGLGRVTTSAPRKYIG